ncbi:hypothetical protein B0T26DRAFT_675020 [Lasiosphaeria miniovina]|uniref:Alcohol dehydrogenase-like C-terminal domain-containing protein n=1 Tax=Lasiosphaeria miniovina TaxID=1954250 RepID=A0AA40AWT9_9PEZI|nr:uncharacterized protein B0T26DRAFT_675020 [Lasiosphaeria miniovina]KAK0723449.1 hypothetical protein B0T26DRAFT_675020 [Lasiosphaeria miniovina]
MAAPSPLPASMKALVCESVGKPLKLKMIPTPTGIPGSVVIKVLASLADFRIPINLGGAIGFTFPSDLCPSGRAIGRIVATDTDTTSLNHGQLVLIEPFVRARDNPDVQIVWGMFDGPVPSAKKFAADNWSKGTLAEYARVPLENCHALNEARLCGSPADGGLGYPIGSLLHLTNAVVPYGGLRSIGLQAGERIVVAPATGAFSGCAVQAAVAMGASVVAMGRDLAKLQTLQRLFPAGRVQVVQTTGDVEADAAALQRWGPVDAFMDVSPHAAGQSTHIRSAVLSVRQYGRVCFEGIVPTDLPVPFSVAVMRNLTIRGQYMYERDDVRDFLKLAETGVFKIGSDDGVEVVGEFKLEQAQEAFDLAAKNTGFGKIVVLAP